MNRRLGTGLDFKPGHRAHFGNIKADVEIFLDETMLLAPLRWKKPRRIFVNSMSDTFAEFVKDEWIDRMFAVMALAPQHTFQVLTKRPERMRVYFGERAKDNADAVRVMLTAFHSPPGKWCQEITWPLPNVWLGTSAEDQSTADERIPLLLDTPAAVRFVSLEPLLGPVNLDMIRGRGWAMTQHMNALTGSANPSLRGLAPETRLDWVIVGGESGPHARPMHPQWARDIRDQCAAAGVPFFMKQWGEWAPFYYRDDGEPRRRKTFNDGTRVNWIGKRAAGRLLDGIEHNGMPT